MFDYAKFAALLSERKNINSESTDELEIYYDKMSNFIASDIDNSMRFIENQCTADEFVWLSEVLKKLLKKLKAENLSDVFIRQYRNFPKRRKFTIFPFLSRMRKVLLSKRQENETPALAYPSRDTAYGEGRLSFFSRCALPYFSRRSAARGRRAHSFSTHRT